MPLPFPSVSHGTVAFGFFNIESDMLLLESLFFFADDFCAAVVESAESPGCQTTLPGWRIRDATGVGNLHGAIAGQDLSGFIGATYARFPFPVEPAAFKQSPEGHTNRHAVTTMIEEFGESAAISLVRLAPGGGVRLGEYGFSAAGFAELIAYVERGGHPRWRDAAPPAYVERMSTRLRERSEGS